MKNVSAIVLAAGLGTRMRSKTAKLLHPVAGRPMIWYMVAAARHVADAQVVVVVGHQAAWVRAFLEQSQSTCGPCETVLQARPMGTAHAVRQTQSVLMHKGQAVSRHCLLVNGDTPLLTRATIKRLVARHEHAKATLTMLVSCLPDPKGYGRVVRGRDGHIVNVVEERDASRAERAIREVNVGTYVVDTPFLFQALEMIRPHNAQREYYLTDLVDLAVTRGCRVIGVRASDASECLGINSRQQLAGAERVMRQRIRTRWLRKGVTMLDPETTFIDDGVTIGRDTVLYPGVTLEGNTTIGADCTIRSWSRVTDSVVGKVVTIEDHSLMNGAVIEDQTTVGPFARLRPGTILRRRARVGNFVEVKNTEIGTDSKANHLTYLGDASIGTRVNIGAGTITCNYDGYQKHRTILEDDAFIGSGTQFIAPVTVGKGAVVGAGSTITRDVPSDAIALTRSPQVNRERMASRRRSRAQTVVRSSSPNKSQSSSRTGGQARV
ncbi:MAG: bifunctional UDP-N-acetylglucosamine diphosphorylase/glucosamine-1-phosphate N-acetyltransferase GlmU [Nitrospira sp.]|nr:bifunctional UDP-N-acetylglucosamine diphosphorylase/glucosamine-1-phosphate N-acetyltransferase GlmU [Nitrospira sp.]